MEKQNIEIHNNLKSENYGILGSHPEIIKIHKIIGRLSTNRLPVLIEGESGTGKHQVAKIIHQVCCPYKEFVTINKSIIALMLLEKEFFGVDHIMDSNINMITKQGQFDHAAGGMILIDEVTHLSLPFQLKFLKALQHNEVSTLSGDYFIFPQARVVAMTQYDLHTLVKNGKFREDLYYYLASSRVVLPPLRERKTDIPLIVHHLIPKICRELKIDTPSITQSATWG